MLEARRTTVLDFHRALSVIEPDIMGLVATRSNARQLTTLRASTRNSKPAPTTPAACHHLARREKSAFAAVRNPALTVIAEILHWVRVEIEPTVTADAKGHRP